MGSRLVNVGCVCRRVLTGKARLIPQHPATTLSHRNVITAAHSGYLGSQLLSSKYQCSRWTESQRQVSGRGAMNVFDRTMKRKQKEWAASLQDSDKYDYLRDEVCVDYTNDLMTGFGPQMGHMPFVLWVPNPQKHQFVEWAWISGGEVVWNSLSIPWPNGKRLVPTQSDWLLCHCRLAVEWQTGCMILQGTSSDERTGIIY